MMNHNDFPKMTEEFDRSVRRALDSLPGARKQAGIAVSQQRKSSAPGLAAALCIGGTAFAANAQSWFPLLFPNGGDANLEGYVQTADNAKLTDENEHYHLSVESVLFDESAGTGVISLHLANKKRTGVKPFTLAHLIDSYRNKPDITWVHAVPRAMPRRDSLISRSCTATAASAAVNFISIPHVRRQRLLFRGRICDFERLQAGESRSVWRHLSRVKRPCVRTERVPQRRFWQSICRNFSRCRT